MNFSVVRTASVGVGQRALVLERRAQRRVLVAGVAALGHPVAGRVRRQAGALAAPETGARGLAHAGEQRPICNTPRPSQHTSSRILTL